VELTPHQVRILSSAVHAGALFEGRFGFNRVHLESLAKRGLLLRPTATPAWTLTSSGRRLALDTVRDTRKAPMPNRRVMRRRYQHTKWLVETLIRQRRCHFCDQPLWHPEWFKTKAHAVTIHHLNHDHDDDRPENHAWAHSRCHKQYHAKDILHRRAA